MEHNGKKYNFVNEKNGHIAYRSRDREEIIVFPDGSIKELKIKDFWRTL